MEVSKKENALGFREVVGMSSNFGMDFALTLSLSLSETKSNSRFGHPQFVSQNKLINIYIYKYKNNKYVMNNNE